MRKNNWMKVVMTTVCVLVSGTLISIGAYGANNVNLGTNGISNPGEPTSGNDEWAKGDGDYVFFGNYPQSDTTGKTFEPILWRVLDCDNDADGDGVADSVFLYSHKELDKVKFNLNRSDGSKWDTSNVRKWLNSMEGGVSPGMSGGFLDTAFTESEKNAIALTYLDEEDDKAYVENNNDPMIGCDLNGDKVFLLSCREVSMKEYGFYPTKISQRNYTLRIYGSEFAKLDRTRYTINYSMFRSPVRNHDYVVGMSICPGIHDNYYVDSVMGVAPALNVKQSSIMFNTSVGYKKTAFGVVGNDKVNNQWNITIQDASGFKAERKIGELAAIEPGKIVTVNVTNIPSPVSTDKYTQISAMLLDSNNNVSAYGKISDNVNTGEIKVSIPSSLTAGNYKLYVFAEDINSSDTVNVVDYATNMVEIRVTIVPIEKVVVSQVKIPNVDENLVSSAVCSSVGIGSVESVIFTKGNKEVTGKAQGNTEYSVKVTVKPKAGYVFDSAMSATINGKVVEVIINSNGTATLVYKFKTDKVETPTGSVTTPTEPSVEDEKIDNETYNETTTFDENIVDETVSDESSSSEDESMSEDETTAEMESEINQEATSEEVASSEEENTTSKNNTSEKDDESGVSMGMVISIIVIVLIITIAVCVIVLLKKKKTKKEV